MQAQIITKAFEYFLQKKAYIYYCADDQNSIDVIKYLNLKNISSFGYSTMANLQITDPKTNGQGSSFDLLYEGQSLGAFHIKLYGEKNISNAAGVILYLLKQGFKSDDIKKAIADFTGARRRFEKIYEHKNTYLFDDYGHHPKEIASTLDAAKKRFPDRRIILIFQPHTFSRTQAFQADFIQSLAQSNFCFILPIFSSAREEQTDNKISSNDLIGKNIQAVNSKGELLSHLKQFLRPKDIVFTMGAGDVYKLRNDIIEVINTL